MITLVEGANRQKTPNEIALTILLAVLTIVFLPVVVALVPFGKFSGATVSIVVIISLLVCLIPTTIGALLSAIGIAGMDRLVQRNVLAMSGRAVEAAGDVQTLLLDKTGTITLGNRMASRFVPVGGHTEQDVADIAQLASLADETPEGRSIVVLAKEHVQHPRARASVRTTASCPSPRSRGCPASTWAPARSARARRTRCAPGWRASAAASRPSSKASSTASRGSAPRRSSSRTAPTSSGSSSSRTS